MNSLLQSLITVVGADHVLTQDADTAPYCSDWRGRYRGAALCVVRPGSTAEVAEVVRLCHAAGIPMVPQAGNTGLCGGATPLTQADKAPVLINVSRLNRVRDLDADNNTITVEAGCILQQVQQAAEAADRLFPLTLAAQGSCEIGGNLSTNAGGVHVLRYGNTRELTLGLEVVLPDGRIWHGLRGLRKDNTGYDLKHVFIGAEGTLGIITAAVLKLFPRPRRLALAWVAVSDPASAVALLGQLRRQVGDRVNAFELIGRPALELVLQHIPATVDPLSTQASWYVLVELADSFAEGEGGLDLTAALERILANEIEAGRVLDATLACSLAQAESLWALRENISEAQRIEGISIKHDIAVPVSRIAEFLERAGLALTAAFGALRVVAFGHLGDGNLHYNLSKPESTANADFIAATPGANRIVHDLVHVLGGSVSAEHGIGQLKRAEMQRYKDPVELDLMRGIKALLDQNNLMNPGKVL